MSKPPLLVVGTLAFDSIETPFGKVQKSLGGSANYFSTAASIFVPIQVVSIIGKDFPEDHLAWMRTRGISTDGIALAEGNTFSWTGKYGYDLNEAHTLNTALNVLEKFKPNLPATYRKTEFVFLGNLAPTLQLDVVSQIENPRLIALDTMNFWIEGQRDTLIRAIGKANIVIINEGEIRQLTRIHNVTAAAHQVMTWGPKTVIVKRGEYGALLYHGSSVFSVPGLPLAEVKDPTGAGDSFAGGFLGYLAARNLATPSVSELRKAVVHGCVVASFTVQDFGLSSLQRLDLTQIAERYKNFVELTTFHEDP